MSPSATASPPLLRRILTLDAAISQRLHTLISPIIPRILLLLLEYSADFRLFFPVTVGILLSSPSSLHRPFGTSFIVGLIIDLILVALIKITFRRPRPHYNKHMNAAVSADEYSFPSGHASRVWFVAGFVYVSKEGILEGLGKGLFGDFDEGKFVEWLVLGVGVWAVVTSVSRVLLGRHFLSDVVAGACPGVLQGLFVFHYIRF